MYYLQEQPREGEVLLFSREEVSIFMCTYYIELLSIILDTYLSLV